MTGDHVVPRRAQLAAEANARAGATPSDETLPRAAANPRLMASWERSQSYGVPLEEVEPVFTGTTEEGSLFFRCGQEVLSDLHRTLASEPVSLMLTDAEGLVLNRLSGDHGLLRALDAVHLAPGFAYSERAAGTNGLGLALADRLPTVVRAQEHYSLSLCSYTCAAAPVFDPRTGRLEGAVNLTTWADSSHDLLLALAQSAAGNTSALMLARSQGRTPRPAPRGEVFRVEAPQVEPGLGTTPELSARWREARDAVERSLVEGHVVAVVGEPGSGRASLLAHAQRRRWPRDRILAARPPDPRDAEAWLSLWTPEVGKPNTAVLVRDVDALPVWLAERLRDLVVGTSRRVEEGGGVPLALTAEAYDDIPRPLAAQIDTVVQLPPLRERPDDVVPLALHVARRVRGRDVGMTPAAERALRHHGWPGNVAELARVVRRAATVADVIDLHHLPPELLAGAGHRLSRIEAFERDEIIRVLSRPGATMRDAAEELGMSRATVYRKLHQYDIKVPR